uniref:Methyltransferase domain-containing protein n=1 Tax=Candidatus Kentrum sp. MB TaxID=2138164 RepID=A0A450XZQ0_9GAMM|nr:MAG: Methyltransferase domain-containing protein [Candidatus Kentron sp. MB]VFK76921.1 MAG: Methyltransferase domain-containing protein [Candidatus Kentron sp. MB]
MKTKLQQIYDEFAETYSENRGLFDMTEILDHFYGYLDTKKGELLDLGCGAGEPVAKWFIDRGWTVTGVDFSNRMLDLASKYVPEMKTIHADMSHIEFDKNRFDAITVIYSLFHIQSNSHSDLFNKFYHWLRPNGKVLFTYAVKEHTGNREFDGYKNFMGRNLYYSHTEPDKLYMILEKIGFNIESADYRDSGNEGGIFLWVTMSKP